MSESMMEWSIRDSKEQIVPGSIMMDGWKLKRQLGQGNFGDVWLAEKNMFGITDQSAIKIIRIPRDPAEINAMRAEGFSDDSIRTELRRNVEKAVREIRAMIDLRTHPAIVPCESFDVIQYEDDETWEIDIRMQLLTSLPDWIKTKEVTAEDVIRMGISLSDLLSVCEKKNILHRDIKPANIFVDQMNNFKLGDFGLARVMSDVGSTHFKGAGTEAFMAPEAFNSGRNDHRADIYSLGLVMYWMLNHQAMPFVDQGISRAQAISKRLAGETLPALSGTDPALNRIIRKACEADPEKRWKTASEFHDALVKLGKGDSVSTSKKSKTEPKEKEKPDKKPLFAFMAVLICVFAIYAIVRLSNEPTIEDNTTNRTESAETRSASENQADKSALLFTITWQDDEGNTIGTTTVEYGKKPTHTAPTKKADKQYTYTFSGWEPNLENVTGNATYKAIFTRRIRSYTITWQDDTGKTINTTSVEYGTKPSHATPVKAADKQYTYTFSGWQPAVKNVTGEATYKATFTRESIPTTPSQKSKPKENATEKFKKKGNIVTFGHYEQDNNTANGKEEIEWIVLGVKSNKALLISRRGLDAKPYNTKRQDVTWETCTLRTWLNDGFYKSAFNSNERSAVSISTIDNSSSQGYSGKWKSAKGGNNTRDHVFLLSYAEANKYFGVKNEGSVNSDKRSRVAPTAYALAAMTQQYQVATYKTEDGKDVGWWWLRSPGSKQNMATGVWSDGGLANVPVNNNNANSGCVRPAIWLDLSSSYFK